MGAAQFKGNLMLVGGTINSVLQKNILIVAKTSTSLTITKSSATLSVGRSNPVIINAKLNPDNT